MGQDEATTATRPAEPRRRWRSVVQAAAVVAIVVGAGVAIYAERTTMDNGVVALADIKIRWLGIGIAAECVSMIAFAQLEKGLLRSGGVTGRALTLRSVLATAYGANAISIFVPVVGSGMATGYAYREFRRRGVEPAQVAVALTLAGILSTVSFGVLAAVGALITGNLLAAVLAGAGGLLCALTAAAVLLSVRFPRPRAWAQAVSVVGLRMCQRVIRRPQGEPAQLVADGIARISSLRLSQRAAWTAFGWALINWAADVACLVCAVVAARSPVPWRKILLIWTAGASAASFCPIPAGLGVVDIVLITALAATGMSATRSVEAVLVYRIITFKILFTVGFLLHQRWAERGGGR